jgi:transposase
VVSLAEQIDPQQVVPHVTQHRRLAVACPGCETRVAAPVPEAARGTPFGPRLHAVTNYRKTDLPSLSTLPHFAWNGRGDEVGIG